MISDKINTVLETLAAECKADGTKYVLVLGNGNSDPPSLRVDGNTRGAFLGLALECLQAVIYREGAVLELGDEPTQDGRAGEVVSESLEAVVVAYQHELDQQKEPA